MIVAKSSMPFYGEKTGIFPANSGAYSYNTFFKKFTKIWIMDIVATLFLLRICLQYLHVL